MKCFRDFGFSHISHPMEVKKKKKVLGNKAYKWWRTEISTNRTLVLHPQTNKGVE